MDESHTRSNLICLQDFEDIARNYLALSKYNFYADCADEGQTKKDCREAFKRYRLRPRVLRDVSLRHTATTILGQPISFPVGISPTAAHRFAHSEGEIATAKAACKYKTVMIVSNCAMTSMKDISLTVPDGLRWMQMHFYRDQELTRHYVREAERNGFKAVVVTVDTPVLGNKLGQKRGPHTTPRLEYRLVNAYRSEDPKVKQALLEGDIALWDYMTAQLSDCETWEDLRWLKTITKLPIVVKGILTGESALEAVQCGVDAILVSAHGGRQLDGVPATIDALPEVVKAVKGTGVEVYMDGGVRTGTDVFKALALGARAVFLGRPILWGLAYDGENGVNRVLEILRDEFSLAMALTGCSRLEDIKPSMVVHESKYLMSRL